MSQIVQQKSSSTRIEVGSFGLRPIVTEMTDPKGTWGRDTFSYLLSLFFNIQETTHSSCVDHFAAVKLGPNDCAICSVEGSRSCDDLWMQKLFVGALSIENVNPTSVASVQLLDSVHVISKSQYAVHFAVLHLASIALTNSIGSIKIEERSVECVDSLAVDYDDALYAFVLLVLAPIIHQVPAGIEKNNLSVNAIWRTVICNLISHRDCLLLSFVFGFLIIEARKMLLYEALSCQHQLPLPAPLRKAVRIGRNYKTIVKGGVLKGHFFLETMLKVEILSEFPIFSDFFEGRSYHRHSGCTKGARFHRSIIDSLEVAQRQITNYFATIDMCFNDGSPHGAETGWSVNNYWLRKKLPYRCLPQHSNSACVAIVTSANRLDAIDDPVQGMRLGAIHLSPFHLLKKISISIFRIARMVFMPRGKFDVHLILIIEWLFSLFGRATVESRA